MDSTQLAADYAVLNQGPAFLQRRDRVCIEVTGRDRALWLHNLTTHQVKALEPGQGNYAFVLNLQGRILFDVNLLVRPEAILLDLDRRFLDVAQRHLSKYIVVEDVRLSSHADPWSRFALVGRRSVELLEKMGVPEARNLPILNSIEVVFDSGPSTLFRSDFCGPPAWEWIVPSADSDRLRDRLVRVGSMTQVGDEVVHIRRIEAGIPWPGAEITEEILPAETQQLERAVSFNKGCYLGQEVVERMRSRSVVARKLVGLRIGGTSLPEVGAALFTADGDAEAPDAKPVGRVTSVCRSLALNQGIALGYVKSAGSAPGETLRVTWQHGTCSATVTSLPFVTP